MDFRDFKRPASNQLDVRFEPAGMQVVGQDPDSARQKDAVHLFQGDNLVLR